MKLAGTILIALALAAFVWINIFPRVYLEPPLWLFYGFLNLGVIGLAIMGAIFIAGGSITEELRKMQAQLRSRGAE